MFEYYHISIWVIVGVLGGLATVINFGEHWESNKHMKAYGDIFAFVFIIGSLCLIYDIRGLF